MQDYKTFLKSKQQRPVYRGFDVEESEINPTLFPYQRDVVRWALKLGKAALFEAVGLGKTIQSLEWASHVAKHTGKPVLILAPLAVSQQTVREGDKFGYEVTRVADSSGVDSDSQNLYISNYERLHKFDCSVFGGVVLDESSVLKNFTGKIKRSIFESFADTPFKLACSATPAPNDHMELGNHAEFLDIMASNEMLSRWFINDTMSAGNYRLKNHATDDFWRWITSLAVCISRPSDLGEQYAMEGFNLPAMNIIGHYVDAPQESIAEAQANGRLFPDTAPSSTQLGKVKRQSLNDRLELCIELVNSIANDEPILIWCTLNDESDALYKAFKDRGAIEVRGSDKPESKEGKLMSFSDGDTRILITKPSIAGHGMNWQHCNQMIFFGLDFSFESFYQAKGRTHRYGQKRPVDCHIIFAETEGNVVQTLYRKQEDFETMQKEMSKAMQRYGLFRDEGRLELTEPVQATHKGDLFTMYQGDCIPVTGEMEDDSIDFSVYSPPFSNLYIYSDSEADMGNAADDDEFFDHYKYLIKEMYRITKPGRLSAVHCKDLPAYINRDGYAGLRDFPGEIIKAHEAEGWAYHSRVTIWKDPVIEMQRTKNHGLLHKNFAKESNACRQGMPDYLLVFRKYPLDGQEQVKQNRELGDYVGENPPLDHEVNVVYGNRTPEKNYSIAVWQRYASPVWFDIDQTNVLNFRMAKGGGDERHICPLQLGVIERSIDLWTNKGDVVFTPFAGIGSEVVSAIKMGRYGVGIELKESYFKQAVKYAKEAQKLASSRTLFDLLDEIGAD